MMQTGRLFGGGSNIRISVRVLGYLKRRAEMSRHMYCCLDRSEILAEHATRPDGWFG